MDRMNHAFQPGDVAWDAFKKGHCTIIKQSGEAWKIRLMSGTVQFRHYTMLYPKSFMIIRNERRETR